MTKVMNRGVEYRLGTIVPTAVYSALINIYSHSTIKIRNDKNNAQPR
jgi:hypothetical protein